MTVNAIANSINPWCEIPQGKRWVLERRFDNPNTRTIAIKSKKEIEQSPSTRLARNFEFMRDVLTTQYKQTDTNYELEDVIALKNLRKVVHEKYNRYCKAHNIIVRIWELFLGLFSRLFVSHFTQ